MGQDSDNTNQSVVFHPQAKNFRWPMYVQNSKTSFSHSGDMKTRKHKGDLGVIIVTQGHWQCHHSIKHIRVSISLP